MDGSMSRRRAMGTLGGIAGGAALVGGAGLWARPARAGGVVGATSAHPERAGRVLRVVHFTDAHVQPERAADQGLIAALRHAQEQKPDLILTGGDSIMDAFEQTRERSRLVSDLWRKILKDEGSVPMHHCIGNHDLWGWDKAAARCRGDEPDWGKGWAVEMFEIPQRYYAFDRAGWKFVVLDSTHPHGDSGYTARLDPEQRAWLESTLRATPAGTPVLVLSHIPILSAATFLGGGRDDAGDWNVPHSWMHIDAQDLTDLFRQHPGVRLALSGHLHMVDRVDYQGVSYLCGGAVSGGWWKGPHRGFREGYALLDLFADGSFEHRYVEYGWEARER